MRRLHRTAFFLLLFAAAPAAARGQVSISTYVRSGLLAPDAYFYERYENFLEGETNWSTGSLGRSALVGGGLELALGDSGILIRAEALRSFEGWLRLSHSRIVPRVFFNPPFVASTWYDLRYTMTMTSVQLVLPTKLKLWGAEPYVSAGGGGKFYEFGETTEPNTTEALEPKDGFTWGGDVGAGLRVNLFSRMSIDLQARDAFSKYWGKFQHDFMYTGSLRVRLH